MRAKSCGFKPRVSRSPHRLPSSTTVRPFPLVNPDDDEYANSSETSAKSDDDSDKVADDGNVREKGRPHVDWMEVGVCIACDGGGTLLICCVTDCPVSIHEKCAQFKLAFDDLGRFYCPYCSCKRQVAKAKELRKKAMLAKMALLDFIDSGTVVGGASAKEKHVDGSHNAHQIRSKETPGIESLEDSMNKEIRDERNIPETHKLETVEEEEGKEEQEDADRIIEDREQAEHSDEEGKQDQEEDHRISEDSEQAEHSDEEGKQDQEEDHRISEDSEQAEHSDEEGKQEQKEDGRGLGMSDSDSVRYFVRQRHVKCTGRKKTAQPRNDRPSKKASPQLHTTPEKKVVNRKRRVTSKQNRESPEKTMDLYFPEEKRKRLQWTHEEEEMLKEGVKKYESTVRKNLPWMKILEFGRHVFHSTRSPSDLKDKWRNIMAKEAKY